MRETSGARHRRARHAVTPTLDTKRPGTLQQPILTPIRAGSTRGLLCTVPALDALHGRAYSVTAPLNRKCRFQVRGAAGPSPRGGSASQPVLLLIGRRPTMAVMTRRQGLGIGATLGAGLLVAACDIVPAGAPQDSQDRPVAPKAARPRTSPARLSGRSPSGCVTPRAVAVATRGPEGQFRQYTRPFTEAHPHLTIEWLTWSATPGSSQVFREAIATGQATDVFQDQDIVQVSWAAGDAVPLLVMQGALLGLNQFVRRDGLRPHRLLARGSGAQHLARRVVRAANPCGYAARLL